ncbi:hypothetical protein [Photobacterium profundum]|uniref:hypothetical protein n=1 Tax=Photobacterium profundum TaxID=74109 RepID=UPI001E2D6026|nr:hypothetical protein [Photobacterium profundum]
MLSSLINIVLDPIFIFTFDMGLKGAALATLTSYAVCIFWLLACARSKGWFGRLGQCNESRNSLYALLKIMIPATLNQLLPPLVAILATMLMAGYGNGGLWYGGSGIMGVT